MTNSIDALVLDSLVFAYPDGPRALDSFCMTVPDCMRVGIVGSNGAGKTTLIHALAGFVEPHSGGITLFGEKIGRRQEKKLRSVMGFTFINPDDQLFMSTVLEDVCFGLLCDGVPPDAAEGKARAILGQFEMEHLADRFPGHLSAGQKRMAALAGVLVKTPRILVMDEPTAFLDPHSRRILIEKLRGIGGVQLIVTHDLEMVLEICGMVVVMANGRNVASGRPDNILSDVQLMKECRLEVPYSLSERKIISRRHEDTKNAN